MQRDAKIYLKDILRAIEKIENYTKNLNFNDFLRNDMVQDVL